MSGNSEVSKLNRRQFLATAGTVAAASSFAVANGPDSDFEQVSYAPLTSGPYVVSIDITTTPISYRAYDGHGHPVPMTNNALQAQPRDSVTWKVNCVGKKYHVTIMFVSAAGTPLVDASNKPVFAVAGTESDEGTTKIGGMIGPLASSTYKYSVRALDDTTGILYPDDPTIIVGRPLSTRKKLVEVNGELRDVQAKIEFIEKELEGVIEELKRS